MSEDETSYAVRIRHHADVDINEAFVSIADLTDMDYNEAFVSIADLTDMDYAVAWLAGLRSTLAKLATFPKRCPLAKAGRFRQEVRVVSYRQGPGGAIYLVYFLVSEAEQDAPTVYILHVRHGARKPMSRAEARKIEQEAD